MPTGTLGTTARQYHTKQTHYVARAIAFTDNGVAVTLGVIPAGSYVINAGVVVTTAFNAGTTNVLDIGTSGDDDGFATDLALGTIGRIAADELGTSNDLYVTADTTLTATVALYGTAATTGAGLAFVEYVIP